MNIEQLYTECQAQGAYYIKSKNEAVIIDPLREVNQYIEKANKDGVKIKYIIETHFQADFVSGHVDLSKKTGATIIFGPMPTPIQKPIQLKMMKNSFLVMYHSKFFIPLDTHLNHHVFY